VGITPVCECRFRRLTKAPLIVRRTVAAVYDRRINDLNADIWDAKRRRHQSCTFACSRTLFLSNRETGAGEK
jgi:hypothetical protein